MIEEFVRQAKASHHTHIKGPWASGISVGLGDQRHHNGATYEAKVPHEAGAANEPGVAVGWEDYWQIGSVSLPAVAADVISFHQAHVHGHHYYVGDWLSEAKSGYGRSVWYCLVEHDGVAGVTNPTGSSGATYWYEMIGGGVNGVSSLAAALDSLAETTDEPVGYIDYLVICDGGTWKRIKVDNYHKCYVLHEIDPASMTLPTTNPATLTTMPETATNKVVAKYMAFNTGVNKEYAQFKYRLPFSYSGGPLKIYMELLCITASTGGVCMGVQAAAVGDGGDIDAAWGAAIEVIDTCQGANKLLQTAVFNNVVIGGTPSAGKHIQGRVYRDPVNVSDDHASYIYLMNLAIECPINKKSEG